jgi:hypothetical protein
MKTSDRVPGNSSRELRIRKDGIEICGFVYSLEKYFMEVEIVDPYCNWKEQIRITGPSVVYRKNFICDYREPGEKLLAGIYHTIKRLDNSLDQYLVLYQRLLKEKAALTCIENEEIRSNISKKLEDWFFQYIGFYQKEMITQIFDIFLDTGIKVFKYNF